MAEESVVKTEIESKAKRSQWYTFLNTTPTSAPSWVREGRGASEMTLSMNPQTTTVQDITQDTASTDITGYQPSMPVSKSVSKSDPTFAFIDDIRRHRKILSEAYTQILNVDVFNPSSENTYPAELQDVSIQIDSIGGPASDPLTINYTYNYRGDGTPGKATIEGGKVTFIPDGEATPANTTVPLGKTEDTES